MSKQRIPISDRAIQIVAENKIRAAVEAGEFDNLPGFGRPAAICDEPYDPYWWIRRKLEREGVWAYFVSAGDSRRHEVADGGDETIIILATN